MDIKFSNTFFLGKRWPTGRTKFGASEKSECIFQEGESNKSRVLCTGCGQLRRRLFRSRFFKNAHICVETFETARRAFLGDFFFCQIKLSAFNLACLLCGGEKCETTLSVHQRRRLEEISGVRSVSSSVLGVGHYHLLTYHHFVLS